VWLAMGGHCVTGKLLAILLPISAFLTLGFEHSVANWHFLPFGLALGGQEVVLIVAAARNIVIVSVGNIVGGTSLVAGVYWLAYLRGEHRGRERKSSLRLCWSPLL
jgi:formate transporter